MKLILTALIIFVTYTVILCQKKEAPVTSNEVKAIINKQSGEVYFRVNKNEKEIVLSKKKGIGKKLFSDQQIRCVKNCTIELQMCTGSKIPVTETDEWYHVPNMVCSKDNYIPGYKDDSGPGGRPYVKNIKKYINEDNDKDPFSGAVLGLIGASKDYRRPRSEDRIFHEIPFNSIYVPSYNNIWLFTYPFEGANVIPELFSFNILEKSKDPGKTKIHLLITLSAFEKQNPLRISKELKKELFFQNGILTNAKQEPVNLKEMQSFLEDVRKFNEEDPARIYCTITVVQDTGINKEDALQPYTFGFEFHVISIKDEKVILEQLEISNKETGIVRYLGRASIFEKLGLIKNATDEYTEALKLFPDNEIIESRLRAINRGSLF